jgi:class 3 adenylate cyclase
VIGDTVNRANRFEMNCPPDKVMVSGSTVEALGDIVTAQKVPGLELKGVTEPVDGYIVLDLSPPPETT